MTNTVTLKGGPVDIGGNFPQKGQTAPDFNLADKTRTDVTLANFAGKRKVLNIFPSIDTPTCATSVRTFNQQAAKLSNTVVLCISADLPFAQNRFCAAEGIENVQQLNLLTDLGCHFGQGWFFSKDLPIEDLPTLRESLAKVIH